MIKENGIKSTVNFQIKLMNNAKKHEDSLPELMEKDSKEEKVELERTSLEKKESMIEKKPESKISPIKVRNVSLPNLKLEKRDTKGEKEKKVGIKLALKWGV